MTYGMRFLQQPRGPTNMVLESKNFWAACEVCGKYVDAEDLPGLLSHAIIVFQARGLKISVGTARHIQHSYELFFKHRIRVAE